MYLPYVNRIDSLTIDFDPVWRKRVHSADRIEVLVRTGLKMLERHVHQYSTTSLSVTNPLSNGQWGFQTGRSTITALLSVTHEWFKVLESGQELFSVCFFDIKKAFDTASSITDGQTAQIRS